MWKEYDIRPEIERARLALGLTHEQFRPLGLTEWQPVEKRMYLEFTEQMGEVKKWTWPWACVAQDKSSATLGFDEEWPHPYLLRLVDKEQICFVYFEGDAREQTKFWWYQGTIAALTAISEELWGCEIGVMDKRYRWLLCLDHHDALTAIGEPMVKQIGNLAMELGMADRLSYRPAMARPAR